MENSSKANNNEGKIGMKCGVLFLGRKRGGFDPEWGEEMKSHIKEFFRKNGYDHCIPSERIADDNELRRAISVCREQGVRLLIATQPTVSDGRLAPILSQLWKDPIIFWSTTEKQTGEMISCNSLVGTHIFSSIFRKLHHPFELVYGHPDEVETKKQFDVACSLVSAAVALKSAKVGLIGQHAQGFINLAVDPYLLDQDIGAQLFHLSIPEFLDIFSSIDDAAVEKDVQQFRESGIPLKDVEPDELHTSSRYYLAFKELMNSENLDALTVRCWPELPNITGQWPYLALSRLISEGVPIVQEGDVDAAVCSLAAKFLGMGSLYMSDWMEHDENTITSWHTGSIALDFCEEVGSKFGPQVARHFNVKKPAVIEATIRSNMPITLFRLWSCDNSYHLTALEGKTIPPKRHLLGNNGLLEIDGVNVMEWFDDLVHQGLPHHVLISRGRHKTLLKHFARLMGLHFIE